MLKNSGVSLIELIISLTIIGILLTFSTPLMLSIYKKNQFEVLKNELSAAINFARSRAILQDMSLVMQPLNELGSWSDGAILFADNKEHQRVEGTKVLHQWKWKRKGLTLTWKGVHLKSYLVFSTHPRQAVLNGRFTIKDSEGKSLELVINRLGRVSVEACEKENNH